LAEDRERLPILNRESVPGFGGAAESPVSRASIAFRHDDSDATLIGLPLALLADAGSAGLPSILGREVLFSGDLRFDPSAGRVYFDPPKGSFIL
jgi:hypothetical protein